MKLKRHEIPIPEPMSELPIADNGYVKPWFVSGDDFRVVDQKKAIRSCRRELCWICGSPFDDNLYALLGSAESAALRVFREPPCHPECAEYAVQVCPFILYPNAKRRQAGLDEQETVDFANENLTIKYNPENPGVYYLVTVSDFRYNHDLAIVTCSEKDVVQIQCWYEGEQQPVDWSGLEQIEKDSIVEQHANRDKVAKASTPRVVPISYSEFESKVWRKPDYYSFVSSEPLVEISLAELPEASQHFPCLFLRSGSNFVLVALIGGAREIDQPVDSDGLWRRGYVPKAIDLYPFTQARADDGRSYLCAAMDENFIVDRLDTQPGNDGQNWHPFFCDKNASKELVEVSSAIETHFSNFAQTKRITSIFNENGLFSLYSGREATQLNGLIGDLSNYLYLIDREQYDQANLYLADVETAQLEAFVDAHLQSLANLEALV